MAEIAVENIENETERSLVRFEASRIFSPEWPVDNDDKVVQALGRQLRFAGGFHTDMKVIDLDTPPNARLNIQKVLGFLRSKPPVTSINSFVIPNVGILESSDQVKDVVEHFCSALGTLDNPIKVNTLTLPCEEVSTDFHKGNLDWIEQFCSHHCVKRVVIRIVKKGKAVNSFQEFQAKFSGEDRFGKYERSDFLKQPKKRNAPQPTDKSKRHRESNPDEEFHEVQCENISKIHVPSESILKKCWKTHKLHKRITGKGVTIAFIDSGINIDHEAFTGRIAAVNDINGDGTIDLTTDSYGHGTVCAFVACGASFKATEVATVPAGVAPGARIVMYKVTNDSGKAHSDSITKALQKCLEDKERHNIHIVLLPYGSDHDDLDQANAILDLIRKGVLVVTASGNHGHKNEDVSYPARLGHTICIGAHDNYYHTTNYTSKGHGLDFTAPGKCLAGACTKHPTAFTIEEGTSYAAASVAGLLALMIEYVSDKRVATNSKKKRNPPMHELVHNQDVMKRVLKNISTNPTVHSKDDGYGHLDPGEIFSKKKKTLEDLFYKDILDSESKSAVS